MINSLSKDSHITLPNAFPKLKHSDRNPSRNYVQSAHVNINEHNKDIFINKPASVTFRGSFVYSMGKNLETIPDGAIRKLHASAKKFVSENLKIDSSDIKLHREKTKGLVQEAVDFIQNGLKSADENVIKFAKDESNTTSLEQLVKESKSSAKKMQGKQLIDIDYDADDYKAFVKKEVGDSIDILHSIEKPGKIYTNKSVLELLKKADKSQAVFSALFAVGLTCFLRPLTIIALPGKKNKDDKKYASAHSISSGLIGYAVAVLVGSPIAAGINNKIAKNPEKYLNQEKHGYLLEAKEVVDGKVHDVVKGLKNIGSTDKFSVAKRYINMVPEFVLAAPKAIVTIALIPPILKYVFGIEKKVPVTAQNVLKPTQNYLAINFRGANPNEGVSTSNSEVK